MRTCDIKPACGGFGEWDCGETYNITEEELNESRSDNTILELGTDELPNGVEDIRGLIHSQPPRVFVNVLDEFRRDIMGNETDIPVVEYFGIWEE
jgi:hypothetical protein